MQKASSGCLEVQEEGCLYLEAQDSKKSNMMILSRLFLVPFLVPVFLLSQVPDAKLKIANISLQTLAMSMPHFVQVKAFRW